MHNGSCSKYRQYLRMINDQLSNALTKFDLLTWRRKLEGEAEEEREREFI